MGRGQTAKAFLPASNVLSSLKTITATPRGLACGTSSSSFILGLAVGGRVVFPPLQSVLSPLAGRAQSILPCSVWEKTCRGFTATGRGHTAKAFLPASNVLSSLKTVTATPRGLACGTSSSSFILGLAVGGRVVFPPLQSIPFAAGGPRVWGHSRFSPAAFGPRAGHLSVQHFTLHQPGQGRQGLSFVAEGAAAHDSVRLHISVWGISPPPRRSSTDGS